MRITGEERIAAPRSRVWEALNDPDILRQCIPGCQALDRESADRLRAIVEVKIGPIGARFNAVVTLADVVAPNSYTINAEGQGGTVGSAKSSIRVRLAENGGATLLSYEVDAQVGGRLAQLGGPIIDATAKQLSNKFFKRFGEVIGGATEVAPAAAAEQPQLSRQARALLPRRCRLRRRHLPGAFRSRGLWRSQSRHSSGSWSAADRATVVLTGWGSRSVC